MTTLVGLAAFQVVGLQDSGLVVSVHLALHPTMCTSRSSKDCGGRNYLSSGPGVFKCETVANHVSL